MKRPAETTTVGAAFVAVIAMAIGWTPTAEETVAVTVLLGLAPAIVTGWVAFGGLFGIWSLFLRGRRGS